MSNEIRHIGIFCAGKPFAEPITGFLLVSISDLDANNCLAAPGNPARSDVRFENNDA